MDIKRQDAVSNEIMDYFKENFAKGIIILIIIIVFFTSCKTIPLVSTETKYKTEVSESKDILLTREQKLLDHLDRIEKTLFNENVTVAIIKTEYDTEKPVDSDTGKPPVKSQTNTNITKKKQGETITSDKSTKSNENLTNFQDNSTINTKSNQVEKVKQESPKDPYRYRYIFYSIAVIAVIIILFNLKKIFSFIK